MTDKTPKADKKDKKKAFEQGTGNNNTTADDSKLKDNRALKDQDDMGNKNQERPERGDESKITNEDRKITNDDQPAGNNKKEYAPVDEDSDNVVQEGNPEVDSPHTDPVKTEKKLPQM